MTHQTTWYGVRCIFYWASESTYEERITVWNEIDAGASIAKAEEDALTYAENNDMTYLGIAQSYHIYGSDIESGSEVFSLMRVSELESDIYLDRFFDTGTERQLKVE